MVVLVRYKASGYIPFLRPRGSPAQAGSWVCTLRIQTIKITGITLTDTETNGEGGIQIFQEQAWGGNSVAREIYHSTNITNGELLVDLKVSDIK
jgi:hypothetical protein